MLKDKMASVWLALAIGFIPMIDAALIDEFNVVIQNVLERLGSVEEKVQKLQEENKVLKEENKRLLQLIEIPDQSIYNKNEDSKDSFPKSEADKINTLLQTVMNTSTNTNRKPSDKYDLSSFPGISSFKRAQAVPSMHVAFRAGLSYLIKDLGSNQIVVYDTVLLNIGNAYNKYSGQMVAPVRGIYLLFFSIYAIPTHECALAIVLNGNKIDTLYVLGSDTGDHISQSRTIPIMLEVGDTVWVRNYPGYEGRDLYGDQKHYYNSFAGVLLPQH